MKLQNLGIRAKLLVGFSLVLVIALVQSLLAVQRLSAVNDKSTEITRDWLPSVRVLGDMKTTLGEVRLGRFKLLLADDEKAVAATEQEIKGAIERFEKSRVAYEPLISSDAERQLAVQMDAAWKNYLGIQTELMSKAKVLDHAGLKATLSGPALKAFAEASEVAVKLIDLNNAGAQKASADADAVYARARMMLFGALAAMIAIGLAIAWYVATAITRSANEAVASARRIAEGDLSQAITANSTDEMGRLLEALAQMQQRLRDIVSGVRTNSEGVASASSQIASGNNDLSSRTEEQASALEETAASMEELSSTVRQNADNARQGNQLAIQASTVAKSGGDVVGKVVETMRNINDSSKKIADIIGVIDGIAFQTNILALNAAVEAARAGEQGRGFAVVAGEVRSLAQRSADAAREIKSLISTSVERVEEGSALVDQAGATMQEVVTSIQRVTDIMAEITSASVEQSAGVGQVSEAVAQMDQATQQNAALVEESAAAAESLKHQAHELVAAVAVFKLANEASSYAPAAAAKHVPSTTAFKPVAQKATVAKTVASSVKPSAATTAPAAKATAAKPAGTWSGADRRGPNRATNVSRLPAAPATRASAAPAAEFAPAASTGTDDGNWETF